jgi:hypothetical protein
MAATGHRFRWEIGICIAIFHIGQMEINGDGFSARQSAAKA